jgi:DNA mismatch endonuclease (patch repair protein)
MTDTLSKNKRSWNMSQIKGKSSNPELIVRSYLHGKGFRFKVNVKNLPGKPDIVLKKYNTLIFVDGCFWHRHKDCKYAYTPKSRKEFWRTKFRNNVKRDKLVNEELGKSEWNVHRIWECEINENNLDSLAKIIKQ